MRSQFPFMEAEFRIRKELSDFLFGEGQTLISRRHTPAGRLIQYPVICWWILRAGHHGIFRRDRNVIHRGTMHFRSRFRSRDIAVRGFFISFIGNSSCHIL